MKSNRVFSLLLALGCLLPAGVAHAAFRSKGKLCFALAETAQRASVLASLYQPENQLDFRNHGGFQSGGVCWWHSRFTRAASYLAYYSPGKPKPTPAEAKRIVHAIAHLESVVEIPGYENLMGFSRDFEREIQSALESWQERDMVRGVMRTINPLRPTSKLRDSGLFDTARTIDRMVNARHVMPYLMLQFPGLSAHAWLVVGARPVIVHSPMRFDRATAYELDVVDSNYPGEVRTFRIDEGDRVMKGIGPNGADAPVYVDFLGDLDRIESALKTACGWVPELYPGYADWGTY
jgi:hypothetical protein